MNAGGERRIPKRGNRFSGMIMRSQKHWGHVEAQWLNTIR